MGLSKQTVEVVFENMLYKHVTPSQDPTWAFKYYAMIQVFTSAFFRNLKVVYSEKKSEIILD